jgi:predicted nucleic acid-binding Zn ribbon protein
MNTTDQQTLCPHCHTETKYEVTRRSVSIEFRGSSYEAEEEVAHCNNCGEEFDMLHLLDPLVLVFDQYRSDHGYPTAHQIRATRERMRLTEEEFGRLLRVDKKTVRLYEGGALPTEAHANMLKDFLQRQTGAA